MSTVEALRGPRCLVIADGARHTVGRHAVQLGAPAFIVTDQRFVQTDHFTDITRSLDEAGVSHTVFADTEPEVPTAQVAEAAAVAAGHGVIIAAGGGSCLDLAKATAVLVAHGGDATDYFGEHQVPGEVTPIIALPTTAGTGSEVTAVAVLNDQGLKKGYSSPYLIPHTALVDPELTHTCPPLLTAMVGADALSHAVESTSAVQRNEGPNTVLDRVFIGTGGLTEMCGLEALRMVDSFLERAVADGSDAEARAGMARAATLAGMAFGTAGNAIAHAMQYPIGALTHTSHGTGVGILLPYVMRFNKNASLTAFARMGEVLGASQEASTDERAEFAITRVTEILHNIGIQHTLAEIGFTEDDIPQAVTDTMKAGRLVDNNPRPLNPTDVERIFRAAWSGDYAPLG